MAVDFGIRVVMDSGGADVDVAKILRRLILSLESEIPEVNIAFAASYTAGDRVYNLTIQVGASGSINRGFEVLVDGAGNTADEKASLVRRIIQTLEVYTLSLTYAATYSAGTTSVNQITLTVS